MGSIASPAIEVEVGPRAMVSIAGGEPANDIMSAGLKADHHIADWEVMDRVSGNRGTVDSYTAWGAYGGLTYRFGGKR